MGSNLVLADTRIRHSLPRQHLAHPTQTCSSQRQSLLRQRVAYNMAHPAGFVKGGSHTGVLSSKGGKKTQKTPTTASCPIRFLNSPSSPTRQEQPCPELRLLPPHRSQAVCLGSAFVSVQPCLEQCCWRHPRLKMAGQGRRAQPTLALRSSGAHLLAGEGIREACGDSCCRKWRTASYG
jgi:hypothetical protein